MFTHNFYYYFAIFSYIIHCAMLVPNFLCNFLLSRVTDFKLKEETQADF